MLLAPSPLIRYRNHGGFHRCLLKIEVKKTLGSFVQKFMASVNDSIAVEVWQAVLGRMEIRVPRSSFNTWLQDTIVVSHDGKTIIIGVPNAFTAKYLEDRLLGFIEDELVAVGPEFDSIVFVVAGDYSGQPISE